MFGYLSWGPWEDENQNPFFASPDVGFLCLPVKFAGSFLKEARHLSTNTFEYYNRLSLCDVNMAFRKQTLKTKMNRRQALAVLGIAATSSYAAPVLMKLNPAAASGGGFFGGNAGGSGGNMGGASGGGDLVSRNPVIQKECSECHAPYNERLLPSSSWRKIMGNLGNHFGEDASLDPATRTKVEGILVGNSGRGGTGPIRISKTRWFQGEHRGDVTQHKAKSWSNCTACHR